MGIAQLEKISKLIRYYILLSTTEAGSGHPTSCLSAVELITCLFFAGFFKFDLNDIENPNNDRFILSKGHAAPLLYSIYVLLGKVSEDELKKLRKFNSILEGHPTPRFPYAEVATGSLGQGLSIGVGMALNGKYLDKLPYRVWVLLGDSELAEGSNWEAIQIASYYKLNNLIGIVDVNRLGQRGETMYGHDLLAFKNRISAFGWKTFIIKDGHDLKEILKIYKKAIKFSESASSPIMIIAKTIKGKGVSFLENKEGWHGKVLSKEDFEKAILEIGKIEKNISVKIPIPKKAKIVFSRKIESDIKPSYKIGDLVSTRKAYGEAITNLFPKYQNIVVLDAEVRNSTFSEIFARKFPDRFFEMFIAEQNMVGVAVGLSKRGKIPFVSTFSCFFTRAFDQIRMAGYSNANIKFVGSHSGVSVGEDGPSQMGLEDIGMFRSIVNSVVFYPCDAISTWKLVELAINTNGIVYIRTTRKETPVIYKQNEKFKIGGFKILKKSKKDKIAIISAGITLFEALKAYEELKKKKYFVRIIDLYCIKPINKDKFLNALRGLKTILTVEDHYEAGGIGEAVKSVLDGLDFKVFSLAVRKIPRSGKPEELLNYEEISKDSIIKKIKEIK